MISLTSYLLISFFLFLAGVAVMVARKNIIAIMLGIELILNAAGLNFAAYTRFANQNIDGHIMSLFIIVIAAAEAAVGLAIVIRFFQVKDTIHIDDATELQS
ncbi:MULTISPECIES: NADH-quinone oxidoreductase subunit NuoK [unclassified Halobacteriovorax]|uniref:NADH-quinone oxidoreductase subunit NuoK n=1 Tax=unclassified Halobacteriovorax TaxID=2639665 RepID=UPI000EA38AC1|nr:NADH-quinone oxidoreductase subunit NuoK [Halobacteriovorax sp. BALOs_7]AYF43077.1 NADH-ubiquinone/plastoquinone oxidoreductase chain 4L [Halobacteriovorax sp. BALOs_7]